MGVIYPLFFSNMVSRTKRLKILLTIPNFDTAGSGKALLNLAKGLDPEVFEVHIACLNRRGVFFKVVENSGIPVHVFPFTTSIRPYFKGVIRCYKISKYFRKLKPDIIHSFHYAADYSEPFAARMSGCKWVFTKKNMNWGGASKNSWYIRSWLAHAIIVQNKDMEESFYRDCRKTYLIPRGVDTQKYTPLVKDKHLQKQYNLLSNDKVLMCVANMVPVKGVDVLMKAFASIQLKYPEWHLFLVGDNQNEYGNYLLNLGEALNIKNLKMCGKQQKIRDYLSLADVVALPTLNEGRKEGSPVALLEAMACAKVVLGSNVPGIKDQLEKFPSLLIQAGEVEAWIQALSKLFSQNGDFFVDLGKKLRNNVIKNYPIELEVKRTERVYLELSNHPLKS